MDHGEGEHLTAGDRSATATDSEDRTTEAGGQAGGTSAAEDDSAAGRFRRLRQRPLLTLSAAAVVLAAAVAVPVATAEDEPECRRVPASVRDLADRPAAATEALDPGADLTRLDSAISMLSHEHVCGDGARALGKVVGAATGVTTGDSGPDEPHTMAQARSAYAVAAALSDVDVPAGLAPGVARMLAEYIVDVARGDHHSLDDRVFGPAVPASEAVLDKHGFTWLGRFLAPREAHAAFSYDRGPQGTHPDLRSLIAELAKHPEAFAVLYDAERAYLAYYLERLTDVGGDPYDRGPSGPSHPPTTAWPDIDLQDLGNRVGHLMNHRARYARDGTIRDLAAFDAAVRRHSRGTFRTADRRLTTRLPMGRIAERPVSGPVKGPLMDGRHQLFTVLDEWAARRGVPAKRAEAMRLVIDDGYVRGLWSTL